MNRIPALRDVEALLCLALILVEKSEEGRDEAMQVFEKLQGMDVLPIGKIFSLHIPLLLGKPDEARKASQRLLDSGALSHEWRPALYMPEYHAGRMPEDEFEHRAGPFGDFQCEFYHDIALEALAVGDRQKAKKYFKGSVDTGQIATWSYHSARMLLQRLESDPTWPSWIPHKGRD